VKLIYTSSIFGETAVVICVDPCLIGFSSLALIDYLLLILETLLQFLK